MTDGFVLVEEMPYGAGVYKVYEDINNDYISITVKPDTGGDLLALDTEHSIISEICIDGIIGIKLNSNDGYNLLSFYFANL